jgi:hypothetical protein
MKRFCLNEMNFHVYLEVLVIAYLNICAYLS